MGLSRLSEMCRNCPDKDTCKHKRMEAVGYLSPMLNDTVELMAAPMAIKHDYREQYIDKDTTITVDHEEIKRRLTEEITRAINPGAFLY